MSTAACIARTRGVPTVPRRCRVRSPRRALVRASSRDVIIGVDPQSWRGEGKRVLVTGANSGIGMEACKQLYEAGCRVLVAARSAEKAEEAMRRIAREGAGGSGALEPVVLDLSRLDSVRDVADSIVSAGVTLDAVVCNAGVAPDRAGNRASHHGAPRRTAEGFEETIGVNHLGHFELVRSLLPSLRRGSRVVVTSSCVHDKDSPDGRNGAPPTLGDLSGLEAGPGFDMCDGGEFDGNKAYKDSKLANLLFARELARRLEGTGVVANAFSPGFCPSSGLFRQQAPPVQALLKFAFDHPPLATTLSNAGRFTAHMVLGDEPGKTTGEYFCGPPSFTKPGEDPHMGGFIRGWLRPEFGVKETAEEAKDEALGRKLWEVSERLVSSARKRETNTVRNNVAPVAGPLPEEAPTSLA
jgi:protochlorophyllide reductase